MFTFAQNNSNSMIVLLSPAKSLNFEETPQADYSTPRMLESSEKLVDILRKKSANNLKKLMGVSDNIAQLNASRFRQFSTPFTPDNAKQAALAFNGDVYTGLQADTFGKRDFNFAQKHLRILSGLYGLLKPLDLIQPYRLEMGTSLKNGRKKNLYEFWDQRITEMLNADLAESGSKIVLNLASQEYFKSIKTKVLEGQVVTVHFKEDRNGVYKVISFNAKKARGAMANLIVKKRLKKVADLYQLDVDGYLYNPALSEENNLVFTK